MTTAMKITRIQLFEGIGNPEQIIDALRRKDRQYLRGVIQWYERFPRNRFLVGFLKKCCLRFGYGP